MGGTVGGAEDPPEAPAGVSLVLYSALSAAAHCPLDTVWNL